MFAARTRPGCPQTSCQVTFLVLSRLHTRLERRGCLQAPNLTFFLLKARQNKLQKKLDRQVQLGVISSEMRTAQLEKLGRRNLKKDDEDEGR